MRNLLRVAGTLSILFLAGCSISRTRGVGTGAVAASQASAEAAIVAAAESGGVAVGATSGRFTVTANTAHPRAGHTATLLPNGSVLLAGSAGLDIDDLLVSYADAELVSPSGQVSSAGVFTTPREFHTATLLQSGKVLITGGNVFNGYPTWLLATQAAELYDPATGKFSATGDMSASRTGHTASLLPDGRVVIYGGTTTPSAEIYDPAKGEFSGLPTPLAARQEHTATVLPSGKVLFIGGRTNSATLATAELYDPATNSFKAVGSMAEQRSHHTATLLPSGKVLVIGGGVAPTSGFGDTQETAPQELIASPSRTAELFDPQTETFSSAGTMIVGRSTHTATLLADGTVLLCGGSGGYDAAGVYTGSDSAEIYDPAAGSFKSAGKMNVGKVWHTATLLPNGTVLLAGGALGDWTLTVIETFK